MNLFVTCSSWTYFIILFSGCCKPPIGGHWLTGLALKMRSILSSGLLPSDSGPANLLNHSWGNVDLEECSGVSEIWDLGNFWKCLFNENI